MARVLIADDQRLVRQGLLVLLTRGADIEVVGEARDGQEAVDLARKLAPDIVLMDVRMPRLNGLAATQQIAALGVKTQVLMVAMQYDADTVHHAVESGAKGFVAKCEMCTELLHAIQALGQGRSYYSASVLKLLPAIEVNAETKGKARLTAKSSEFP